MEWKHGWYGIRCGRGIFGLKPTAEEQMEGVAIKVKVYTGFLVTIIFLEYVFPP